jgi:hypothetical protein
MQLIAGDIEVGEVVVLFLDLEIAICELPIRGLDAPQR